MLIPFITANLIDAIKDGATVHRDASTAGFLVLIALTSLAFGAAAGVTCSHVDCGFAKNLRRGLFCKIQTFSFANIDEYSLRGPGHAPDHRRHQHAAGLSDDLRIAVRAPLVLIVALTMALIMGWQTFHFTWPSSCWAVGSFLISMSRAPSSRACSASTTP